MADVQMADFNPFDPGYDPNPWPQLNALRDSGRLLYWPLIQGYLLTRG